MKDRIIATLRHSHPGEKYLEDLGKVHKWTIESIPLNPKLNTSSFIDQVYNFRAASAVYVARVEHVLSFPTESPQIKDPKNQISRYPVSECLEDMAAYKSKLIDLRDATNRCFNIPGALNRVVNAHYQFETYVYSLNHVRNWDGDTWYRVANLRDGVQNPFRGLDSDLVFDENALWMR